MVMTILDLRRLVKNVGTNIAKGILVSERIPEDDIRRIIKDVFSWFLENGLYRYSEDKRLTILYRRFLRLYPEYRDSLIIYLFKCRRLSVSRISILLDIDENFLSSFLEKEDGNSVNCKSLKLPKGFIDDIFNELRELYIERLISKRRVVFKPVFYFLIIVFGIFFALYFLDIPFMIRRLTTVRNSFFSKEDVLFHKKDAVIKALSRGIFFPYGVNNKGISFDLKEGSILIVKPFGFSLYIKIKENRFYFSALSINKIIIKKNKSNITFFTDSFKFLSFGNDVFIKLVFEPELKREGRGYEIQAKWNKR